MSKKMKIFTVTTIAVAILGGSYTYVANRIGKNIASFTQTQTDLMQRILAKSRLYSGSETTLISEKRGFFSSEYSYKVGPFLYSADFWHLGLNSKGFYTQAKIHFTDSHDTQCCKTDLNMQATAYGLFWDKISPQLFPEKLSYQDLQKMSTQMTKQYYKQLRNIDVILGGKFLGTDVKYNVVVDRINHNDLKIESNVELIPSEQQLARIKRVLPQLTMNGVKFKITGDWNYNLNDARNFVLDNGLSFIFGFDKENNFNYEIEIQDFVYAPFIEMKDAKFKASLNAIFDLKLPTLIVLSENKDNNVIIDFAIRDLKIHPWANREAYHLQNLSAKGLLTAMQDRLESNSNVSSKVSFIDRNQKEHEIADLNYQESDDLSLVLTNKDGKTVSWIDGIYQILTLRSNEMLNELFKTISASSNVNAKLDLSNSKGNSSFEFKAGLKQLTLDQAKLIQWQTNPELMDKELMHNLHINFGMILSKAQFSEMLNGIFSANDLLHKKNEAEQGIDFVIAEAIQEGSLVLEGDTYIFIDRELGQVFPVLKKSGDNLIFKAKIENCKYLINDSEIKLNKHNEDACTVITNYN